MDVQIFEHLLDEQVVLPRVKRIRTLINYVNLNFDLNVRVLRIGFKLSLCSFVSWLHVDRVQEKHKVLVLVD